MISGLIIQAGNPRTESAFDDEDASLSDAIQSLFPMHTEYMLIIWNNICIPLSYKYDFSLMIDDVIDLVTSMLDSGDGQRNVNWPSNTFAVTWSVSWALGQVTIEAQWNCVIGRTEALLAASGPITMTTGAFLAEWKRPLEIVSDALVHAGYTKQRIRRLPILEAAVRRIQGYGELYADPSIGRS